MLGLALGAGVALISYIMCGSCWSVADAAFLALRLFTLIGT